MSMLDLFVAAVIVLCVSLGIYWGFIRQVLSIAGLITGLVLANRYGDRVADALSSYTANEAVAQVLGFVLVLIAVTAIVSLLATLLRRFVGLLFLGWLDHLVGGVLGLLQGVLVSTVFLLVAAFFSADLFAGALADSRIAPQLLRVAGAFVLLFLPVQFQAPAQQLLAGG